MINSLLDEHRHFLHIEARRQRPTPSMTATPGVGARGGMPRGISLLAAVLLIPTTPTSPGRQHSVSPTRCSRGHNFKPDLDEGHHDHPQQAGAFGRRTTWKGTAGLGFQEAGARFVTSDDDNCHVRLPLEGSRRLLVSEDAISLVIAAHYSATMTMRPILPEPGREPRRVSSRVCVSRGSKVRQLHLPLCWVWRAMSFDAKQDDSHCGLPQADGVGLTERFS